MGLVSKTYSYSDGAVIQAAEHNTNLDTLFNVINGNLDNANIKSNAGIEESKITFATGGHDHSGGSKGAKVSISALTISGEKTGDLIYYSGTAWARIATGTAGTVLTMSSGVPTWL